ncbi:MAG: hypothetical protein CR986_09850 [Ignavibacteriae bacterium]|nr:MAG: hypothetical protein CR986_09850 [Ignavibacteriota bacterium]
MSSIPSKFENHAGYIPWENSWDRPFLEEYFQIGLKLYNKEKFEEAYWIFSHLLELSPQDNLGVRYYAINCCFEFGRHIAVVNICDRFPEYHDSYLFYAKALAMFSTHTQELYDKQIALSIKEFPKFAKLISQKNKKENYKLSKGGIIVGSKEEIHEYWNFQGKYWRQNPEAVERVRMIYKLKLKNSRKKKIKYKRYITYLSK